MAVPAVAWTYIRPKAATSRGLSGEIFHVCVSRQAYRPLRRTCWRRAASPGIKETVCGAEQEKRQIMSSNPPTPVLVTLGLLFSTSVGFAADTHGARSGDSFHWISPIGGAFAASANWAEGTPPQWDDTAIFDLASVLGYTVNHYMWTAINTRLPWTYGSAEPHTPHSRRRVL